MISRTPAFFEYSRLSALLAEVRAEILIVCSRQNVGYVADYTYYVGQGLPTILEDGREWSRAFAGLPTDEVKGAFLTVQAAEEHLAAHADPWIVDRRLWGPAFHYSGSGTQIRSPESAPENVVDVVAAALRDRGLGDGTIALELSAIPADAYMRLRGCLPKATFVDAAPILWDLRLHKAEEELRRLRLVAQITDAAIGAGYEALHEGLSEEDMRRVMASTMAARGAEFGWTSIAYGPKGALNVEPTGRLPKTGEIVRVDLVGMYRGYYSDMSRVGSFGTVHSREARYAHDTILKANELLRREAGPGVRCSDLYRMTSDFIGRRGFHTLAFESGHGIGRDVGEPPYLTDWDDTVLGSGMVICLEPAIRVAGVGSVNIEDMVVVTDNGCEPLTVVPRELLSWPRQSEGR